MNASTSSEVCVCCGTRRSVATAYEACPAKNEGKEHEWAWCGDNYPKVSRDDVATEQAKNAQASLADELVNVPYQRVAIGPGDGPVVMVIDCLDDSRCVSDPFGHPAEDEFGNRLTQDSAARKDMPMFDGLIDYFPDALAYVSQVSLEGAEKWCGGKLGWDRTKSTDHLNCAVRHLCDIRGRDPNSPRKLRHAGMLAWRTLAYLQLVLEQARLNGEKQ